MHPERFTRALLDAAIAKGAKLKHSEITGLELGTGGTKVTGVRVGDDVLPADAAVITMGPWSVLATAWLPMPLVDDLKSHSILIRTAEPVPARALFAEFVSDSGDPQAPEIIPRADGEVYVCGI